MSTSSIDNLYGAYLSPESIVLGRLFTEVKVPSDNYLPLSAGISIKKNETHVDKVDFVASKNFTGDFNSSISSLLSVDLEHKKTGNVTITFNKLDVSHLELHDGLLGDIVKLPDNRLWIQKAWRKNDRVYLLTGYMVANSVHQGAGTTTDNKISSSASISPSVLLGPAAARIVQLAIGDPSNLDVVIKGSAQGGNTADLTLDVITPTIVAVSYREVHLETIKATWWDHFQAKVHSLGHFEEDDFGLGKEITTLYLATRG